MLMCAVAPRIFDRISRWRPVMSPSATISAMTPTTTPSTEIAEITEMKACFGRAVRERSAIRSSKGIGGLAAALRPHVREQDHVADGGRVRQDHRQTVDPDPDPARGPHPVAEGADVVVVHLVRLVVPLRALPELLQEAVALLEGIVQLREAVGDL